MKIDFSRLIITTAALLFAFAATAQEVNPFIGTWDIDQIGRAHV